MASVFYNSGKRRILKAEIDLETETLKLALVGASYIPDIDGHEFYADISNEISGGGYSAGGRTLDNAVVGQDNDNDQAVFDADDLTWPIASFTVHGAVLYQDTGSAATSPLIAYFDFDQDYSPAGEDFTVQWNPGGVLTLGD